MFISDGYSGRNCDTPPDLCAVNSCQNGATCVNGQSNYTCTCPYGYSGYFCEKQASKHKQIILLNEAVFKSPLLENM